MAVVKGTWAVVRSNLSIYGVQCLLCGVKTVHGEVVYLRAMGGAGPSIVQHETCLRQIVNSPNIPIGETSYHKIKETIVATGDAFAEVEG